MAINKLVGGQAKMESVHFYGKGSVRAIGSGVNENGDRVKVDVRGSYTDENNAHYKELTATQKTTLEKAAAIIAAMWGDFDGGDINSVKAELTSERTASIVKKIEPVEPI